MYIPDPEGMQIMEWSDAVQNALINYQCSALLLDANEWQTWGMMFFNDPYLATLDPPNPYDYDDWQDWARRIADAMGPALGSPPGAGPGPFSKANFITDQTGNFLITQAGNFIVTQ